MSLEKNWQAPLAANASVAVTLSQCQDMERDAAPALLGNWRFQQALYRAYYDAYIQSRLAEETAQVGRAMAVLRQVDDIGWTPAPLEIGEAPSTTSPNGRELILLLDGSARYFATNTDPLCRRQSTGLGCWNWEKLCSRASGCN